MSQPAYRFRPLHPPFVDAPDPYLAAVAKEPMWPQQAEGDTLLNAAKEPTTMANDTFPVPLSPTYGYQPDVLTPATGRTGTAGGTEGWASGTVQQSPLNDTVTDRARSAAYRDARLCVNCRYHGFSPAPKGEQQPDACFHPTLSLDPVTGGVIRGYGALCRAERAYNGACGSEGKLYQPQTTLRP